MEAGKQLGRKPGDWFGPQTVLNALKIVSQQSPIKGFRIAVCSDGNIFLDKILKKIKKGFSVLVGVPMKLGIGKTIPSEYLENLKRIFEFEQQIGIAGGQDHRSVYFIGMVNPHCNSDPNLIHLDPHFVQ
jgi:hypothetical protein